MTKWDEDRSCDDSFFLELDSPNESFDLIQFTETNNFCSNPNEKKSCPRFWRPNWVRSALLTDFPWTPTDTYVFWINYGRTVGHYHPVCPRICVQMRLPLCNSFFKFILDQMLSEWESSVKWGSLDLVLTWDNSRIWLIHHGSSMDHGWSRKVQTIQ